MKLYSIHDKEFKPYGFPLEGINCAKLIAALKKTGMPEDRVIYEPSEPALEALPVFETLQNRVFGGLPIQAGYCNGFNTKLNCLEYHRNGEVLVAADEIILLVAKLQDCEDFTLNTAKVQAFTVPAGEAVYYYETTLHYAPARKGGPFRTAIVLPKGTNTGKPRIRSQRREDDLLRARNKWLIAHPDSAEAHEKNVFVGLTGKNIDVS